MVHKTGKARARSTGATRAHCRRSGARLRSPFDKILPKTAHSAQERLAHDFG